MASGGEGERGAGNRPEPARRAGADHSAGGEGERGADLVAVVAARRVAADAIRATWDAGDAVVVLDPGRRRPVADRLTEQPAPTAGVADGERARRTGGIPVAEGTAAVVVTSGTTARPKGVELTYDGISAIGHGWAAAMGHEADDHW